jgi:hypothetical protein
MKANPWKYICVFTWSMRKGDEKAKMLNIVILNNGQSVWVDPGFKKEHTERASICKLPRGNICVCSLDWCKKAVRRQKCWILLFLTMGEALRSIQGFKKSVYKGLLSESYPVEIYVCIHSINAKRWWEGKNAKYCHSWQWAKHSGRSRV